MRGYTVSTMALAQRLRAGGWSIPSICDIIERETGKRPARTTVHNWVAPEFAEARRRRDLAHKNARDAAASSGSMRANHGSAEFRLRRMQVLHAAGLSMHSIAKVMNVDFPDAPLSEHQVRGAIDHGRIPRSIRRATEQAAA